MKKLVLILVIIAISLIFCVSCKKEEKQTNNSETEIATKKDYNSYIKELIEKTGIDIYEFRQLDKVRKLSAKSRGMMYALTEASLSKGEITEEKLDQLENLKQAIDVAYQAGNDYQVLCLFESFCAICKTIDGFIFHTNQYGMQTFTFDPTLPTLELPMAYMLEVSNDAEELVNDVEDFYPSFSSLLEETQIEVLTAAIYLNQPQGGAKGPVQDCERGAWEDYAWSLAGAHAGLTVALNICPFTGPGVGACVASAFTGYGIAVAWASIGYKRVLKRCSKL
ncbi:MAG: hypothetical protein LBI45_02710 [Bacteroidales bacterium]|jgi:hypothetical protein|nr:hypothetical protein [Bacteroidales bacterium]